MKVCLISRQFYPATKGGSELYMYEIYKRVRRGNEVKILTYDKVDHESAEVLPFPKLHQISAPVFSVIAGLKARSGNYDVVHINAYWSEFAGLFTRRSILTVHDVGLLEEKGILNKIKVFVLRKAMKKAEKVVTVSEKEKKRMEENFGIDKEKIKVIPNGVDLEKYNPKKHEEGVREKYGLVGKKIILSVGRYSRNKGYVYLIGAFKEVNRKFRDACLIIAGAVEDKRYFRELKNMVEGGDNIFFLQNVTEDEKVSLFATCDIYCQPSISSEGFGISLLEAMASGKPCVATDVFSGVGHVPEEFLVENRNEKNLADKIIELLEFDYERIGMSMRRRVEKYSWDNTVDEILKLYKEVKMTAG
jgi:glycosyltransferase involved in cell wall biosynthesis